MSKNNTWIELEYGKIEERKRDKKWYLFGEETAHTTTTPPVTL